MNGVTVVSHFSEPNWPLVNKLSMIAKCLEVNRIHCSSLEKLRETMSGRLQGRTLFFTDEGLMDQVQQFDAQIRDKKVETAMFIRSPITAVAQKISDLSLVKYLIGSQPADGTGRDLSILIKKFADGDILHLDKYLAFGSKVNRRLVSDARSKREAVEAVSTYVSNLGDPGYQHPYGEYSRIISGLTDELLLNAIFNANPRMRGIDRARAFNLEEHELIEISWGYDGEYFGVSVMDPFGRFTSDTIMNFVSSQRSAESIAHSPSAGLGLKFIFDKAHQVITNVKKEKATEVIALVKFNARILDFETQKKSFYYFGEADLRAPRREGAK